MKDKSLRAKFEKDQKKVDIGVSVTVLSLFIGVVLFLNTGALKWLFITVLPFAYTLWRIYVRDYNQQQINEGNTRNLK